MRLKNKQDAFAEIEKSDYTYDHNGKIIIVKKPNLQRVAQDVGTDFQLHQTQQQTAAKPLRQRLQSAKPQQQKELKVVKEVRKEESVMLEVISLADGGRKRSRSWRRSTSGCSSRRTSRSRTTACRRSPSR